MDLDTCLEHKLSRSRRMAFRCTRTALMPLLALLSACDGLKSSPNMDSTHQREARAFIERWDKVYINGAELLAAVRGACPKCSDQDLRAVLDAVAHGSFSAASACAAAALCQMAGLGDPLDTAFKLFQGGGRPMTEPHWFAWIAGYSYNWICNSGLPACYFEFGDQQYADRIRVYDTIGAKAAAAVLRDADQAFGEAGPPPIAVERGAAWSAELHRRLEALGPRFSACKYEIFTCIFLYSQDHPGDFKGVAGQ
ncbi:MAG: hypothetical protein ACK52K_12480 [Alphaproteobacteria bacterium]